MIDTFSRFINLYPLKTVNAKDAVTSLIHHVGLFGVPKELLSDNGTQFANELMTELLNILNINQLFTTPYSKEENAIVERSNKEVMRHLRAIIFDKKILADWYIYLPMVQRIINSKVHLSTNVAPSQIILPGIDLNRNIINDEILHETTTHPLKLSDWMIDMIDKQKHVIEVATRTLKDHELEYMMSKKYEFQTEFPINSFVLVDYPTVNGKAHPPNKLVMPLAGPYRVIDYSRKGEYTLMDLVTNTLKTGVHVKRSHPYHHDDALAHPSSVANTDKQAFLVEKVISHTGNINKVSSLKFLVKWHGFDESENSYQDWKDFRTNRFLHEYLISKNLGYLIPKSFHYQYNSSDLVKPMVKRSTNK